MVTVNANSVTISDENVDITVAKGKYVVITDGSDVAQVLSDADGKITTVSSADAQTLISVL